MADPVESEAVQRASHVINSTSPGNLALRAAARLYADGDDDHTGMLLQLMYEQSVADDDVSRLWRNVGAAAQEGPHTG